MSGILAFIVLSLLVGIGPGALLAKGLSYVTILSIVALSLSLGWLLLTSSVLVYGQFGGSLNLASVLGIGALLAVGSFVIAFRELSKVRREVGSIKSWISHHLECQSYTALFGWLLLTLFYFYLFVINGRIYTPSWDHFTYWLVDAKEIFETGMLRRDGRITDVVPYSSFQPLQAAMVYFWNGEITEQIVVNITLLFGYLATVLIFLSRPVRWSIRSCLLVALLIVVNLSLAEQLLTFYADVSIAFVTALFFYLLINVKSSEQGLLAARNLTLVFLLLVLYLIKTTNLFYMPVFIFAWAWFDISNGQLKLLTLKKLGPFQFFLLCLLIGVVASRIFYWHALFAGELQPHEVMNTKDFVWDLSHRVKYVDRLFDFLFGEYTLLFISYCVFVAAVLSIWKFSSMDRVLICAALLFPAVNVGHYAIGQYSLDSRSLLRYLTTGMFLMPLAIAHWNIEWVRSPVRFIAVAFISFGVVVAAFSTVIVTYPHFLEPIHSGRYAEFKFLSSTADIARRVQARVGNKAVLIATDNNDHYVSNMDMQSLQYRYFLTKNSVGGLYRIGKDYYEEFLAKLKPRYVLIPSFNDQLKRLFPDASPPGNGEPRLFRIKSFDPWKVVPVRY